MPGPKGNLGIYEYDITDPTTGEINHDVGMIAQEVREKYPSAIKRHDVGNGQKFEAIDYGEMPARITETLNMYKQQMAMAEMAAAAGDNNV